MLFLVSSCGFLRGIHLTSKAHELQKCFVQVALIILHLEQHPELGFPCKRVVGYEAKAINLVHSQKTESRPIREVKWNFVHPKDENHIF